MLPKVTLAWLLMAGCVGTAHAYTPAGNWTLRDFPGYEKDYSVRVDVDPGEKSSKPGLAPSSVFWPAYITFKEPMQVGKTRYGSLGLARLDGKKSVIVEVWGGIDVNEGALPAFKFLGDNPRVKLQGDYDWKIGHNYRFRMERDARLPSDSAGEWWKFTLADLTMQTVSVLGSLKLPYWGGVSPSNRAVLTYLQGPYDCASIRHARITMGQIRANYNGSNVLQLSNGDASGTPDQCAKKNILPDMSEKDYGASSWDVGGTVTLLGDQFMGIHQWGRYGRNAVRGMMFAEDISAEEPYLFEALHDGAYGAFPEDGKDNRDWKSIGIGYPIINDLRLHHQRVREWDERNNDDVAIGDYFIYHNPYNRDTEYFRLKSKQAGYFPIDKMDDNHWEYIGRYPKKNDTLWSFLPERLPNWDHPTGKKGWLYLDKSCGAYYALRHTGEYGRFPFLMEDNEWWEFVGYTP